MDEGTLDPAEIRKRVARFASWYHQIEVCKGVQTPGTHASPQALRELDRLGLPQDLSGKRVLDVGCRDGFFSFVAESRGAEVLGIDYASSEQTGFPIAAEILGSKAEYVVENVYDLTPERYGLFDVVLFLGVLYHLRSPLQALDSIRKVTRTGALLFVETAVASDAQARESSTPLLQFLPRGSAEGDPSNQWAPNMACLRSLAEESRFEVLQSEGNDERGYLVARASEDHELEFYQQLDRSTGKWER